MAAHHAREACRLGQDYGEAWATLGFVLDRTGHHTDALAASRRAVTLEADNWRHHLRLASVSWGEERLREARRTLALLPGFPLAHWLSRHGARRAAGVRRGRARARRGHRQPGQSADRPSRFSGVALHWLRGLVYLARGDERRGARVARARAVVRGERSSLRARMLREHVVRDRRCSTRDKQRADSGRGRVSAGAERACRSIRSRGWDWAFSIRARRCTRAAAVSAPSFDAAASRQAAVAGRALAICRTPMRLVDHALDAGAAGQRWMDRCRSSRCSTSRQRLTSGHPGAAARCAHALRDATAASITSIVNVDFTGTAPGAALPCRPCDVSDPSISVFSSR